MSLSYLELRRKWASEQDRFVAMAAYVDGARLIAEFIADLDAFAAGLQVTDQGFVDTPTVARLLNVDTTTVVRWCKRGIFPGAIQLSARFWRIPAAEVLAIPKTFRPTTSPPKAARAETHTLTSWKKVRR